MEHEWVGDRLAWDQSGRVTVHEWDETNNTWEMRGDEP